MRKIAKERRAGTCRRPDPLLQDEAEYTTESLRKLRFNERNV